MKDIHALFHSLQQLSRELTKGLNEALQPFDIYSSHWSVLYVLKNNGSLTQKEIADYLSIEAPPITRTIQKLVELGYVKQVKGKDKRTKNIELTESSLEMFPKWEEAVLKMNKSLLDNFPVESQDQLMVLVTEWNMYLSNRGNKLE